ncbi:hypothetical protein JCM8208_004545 [Rhodotorula glutinis]
MARRGPTPHRAPRNAILPGPAPHLVVPGPPPPARAGPAHGTPLMALDKRNYISLTDSDDSDDAREAPGAAKVARGAGARPGGGEGAQGAQEGAAGGGGKVKYKAGRAELVLSDDDDLMDLDLVDVDAAEYRRGAAARAAAALAKQQQQQQQQQQRDPTPPPVAGPAPGLAAHPLPPPAPHPSPPAPSPPAASDPLTAALDTVSSILPDVCRTTVRALLGAQEALGPANVEAVLDELFGWEGAYPREAEGAEARERESPVGGEGKGKGKEKARDEEEQAGAAVGLDEEDEEALRIAKQWVEVAGRKALGRVYEDAALLQLYSDYPIMRQADLKHLFVSNSSLYAPAWLAIDAAWRLPVDQRPFKQMAAPRADKGKGKANVHDELEREKTWVKEHSARYLAAVARNTALEARLEAEVASGAYFECGCCFADVALSQMVTCAEGCHFCKDCARMNADTQIGMRKYVLPCMSTSGCAAKFLEREYPSFLSRKSIAALHRIKQEKEVDEAALEGLEKCPFCPFAMIIENPDERLFRCQREDCEVVSCRECKKKDHLPATCAEASDDARLSKFHAVEEAMSAALIRRCPKPGCGEPYVKESGTCNKIICSACRTLSCYICGKIGYQHFSNPGTNLPAGLVVEAGATCALWDDTDKRNYEEVEAARVAAEAAARAANPALKQEDLAKLAMDLPPPPPRKIAHLPPPRIENPWLERARAAAAAAYAAPAAAAEPPPPARLPPPPAPVPQPPPPVGLAAEIVAAQELLLAQRHAGPAAPPPAPRAHVPAPAAPPAAAPRRAPAPAAAPPPPPAAGRFLVNRARQQPPLFPPPAHRARQPVPPPAPVKPILKNSPPRKNGQFAPQPQERGVGPAAAGPAFPRAGGSGVRFAPYPGGGGPAPGGSGQGGAAARRGAGARFGEQEEADEAARRRKAQAKEEEREAKRRRLTGSG